MGHCGLSCSGALNGSAVDCCIIFNYSAIKPSPYATSRSNQNRPFGQCGSRPLISTQNKKEVKDKPYLSFIWAAVDSNHRPHPYQGCALTT